MVIWYLWYFKSPLSLLTCWPGADERLVHGAAGEVLPLANISPLVGAGLQTTTVLAYGIYGILIHLTYGIFTLSHSMVLMVFYTTSHDI